nr:translation initiation factor IF-2-like [Gorilla gorilla gorilla]
MCAPAWKKTPSGEGAGHRPSRLAVLRSRFQCLGPGTLLPSRGLRRLHVSPQILAETCTTPAARSPSRQPRPLGLPLAKPPAPPRDSIGLRRRLRQREQQRRAVIGRGWGRVGRARGSGGSRALERRGARRWGRGAVFRARDREARVCGGARVPSLVGAGRFHVGGAGRPGGRRARGAGIPPAPPPAFSALHPSRPGAPARTAAAAASSSPRAPCPSPQLGREPGNVGTRTQKDAPEPGPAAGSLWRAVAGERTRALAVENGRSARKGEPGLRLLALPVSWLGGVRRRGGRDWPWGEQPGGEWLLGAFASGGPARPPSERRQVRAFSLFPALPERTLGRERIKSRLVCKSLSLQTCLSAGFGGPPNAG